MAQTMANTLNAPAWVDLSSGDAAGSREFYGKLFGWKVEVNPDPMYGGYALARIAGKDAAGIGPKMDPNAPTAWSVYIGDRKSTRLNSSHTVIYTLSLHDALPISDVWRLRPREDRRQGRRGDRPQDGPQRPDGMERVHRRSEEHTSELQSHRDLHSFPTRRSSDLRCMAATPSRGSPARTPRGSAPRWTPTPRRHGACTS